jgi:hypothetical protein
MPFKESGESAALREIDRREHGVGWMAYPNETMQRASHAIEVDGEVWVADPVDAEGLDGLLAEFGDVAGTVVLLDRHKRDAAAIANRHGVSVHVPEWMDDVAPDLDAPVERVHTELADTGIGVHKIVNNRFWQEAVLYVEDRGTLVVPEAVGTADYFRTGSERLGVHPMLRPFPPGNLRRFSPERVLVGHGEGVHEDAAAALADALSGSLARTPKLYGKNLKNLILG